MIVVDASALAKYVLREDGWEQIGSFIRDRRPLTSVDHVLKEVGNALWKHYVRGFIDAEKATRILNGLLGLVRTGVIILESETNYLSEAMRIALETKITLYDALYVAQALRRGELLTCDRRQASVAREKVSRFTL